jgi:anti-sigma B factor antagonist
LQHSRPVSVRTTRTGDTLDIAAAGEIDLDTVHLFHEALLEAAGGTSRRVVVDLHDVAFMDSSGLLEIRRTHQQLRGRGGTLILRRPQPQVLRAIRLLRLDEVVAVVGAVEPGALS